MSDLAPGPSFYAADFRCPGCNRVMTKRHYEQGIESWDCSPCKKRWRKRKPSLPGFTGTLIIASLARMRRHDWPGYRVGY